VGALGYGNNPGGFNQVLAPPQADINVGGTVVQIACGGDNTCAILDTGALRCWGTGILGRLGYGNTNEIGDDETPALAGDVPVGGKVVQVAISFTHTCAVLDTGGVRCWGDAELGMLGYNNVGNNIGDNETPASVGDVPVGGPAVMVAVGRWHSCALLTSGGVRCWGHALQGELGYGNVRDIGDDETPASAGDVMIGGGAIQAIVAGEEHTCVLLAGGAIRCWGLGGFGRLGYGNSLTIGDDEVPAVAGDVPF
jgi:alpha-tubulin suppressor-like RCC1 family protein